LRATAEKLRRDMADANTAVVAIGKSGEESGRRMARGMSEASTSVRKVAEEATEATLAMVAAYHSFSSALKVYGAAAATTSGSTEELVTGLRTLRIAASAINPAKFGSVGLAATTVATGMLVEETIKLTNARAKLIEQQSLLAATSGRSIGGIEAIHEASSISGASESNIQGLINAITKNSTDNPGGYRSGLASLSQSPSDADAKQWVDELGQIAQAFESIEDPANRAALAVQLFGKEHAGEALEQLNQRFVDGVAAVSGYGLALDETARTNIDQFHRDIESLRDPLGGLKADLNALGESAELSLSRMGGAFDANLRRSIAVMDILLGKLPGVAATMALVNGPKSLSLRDIKKANDKNWNYADVVAGKQADDSFAAATESLESLKRQQSAAQSIADSDYTALDDDRRKRKDNPKDPSLMSGEQRMSTEAQRQAAAHNAIVLQGKITAMQESLDAEKKAEALAKQLADFQAGATARLDALYQSATASEIKDPLARQVFESRVEIGRDSDRTTPEEKQGRAVIELGKIKSAAQAEQLKDMQAYMSDVAKTQADDRAAFEKLLKQYSEDWTKHADGQRSINTGQMESARSSGEHGVRMSGIQSQPGNEAQLAATVRDLRLDTVAAERAILESHQNAYSVEQMQVETDRLDKETSAARLEYEEQIAALLKERVQAAIQAGGAYQQRLKQLAQEVDALNSIKVTTQNVQDIEAARKALNDQILESTVQQKLAIGDLASGWNAFFISMQEQAEKPGKILFDGMNSALDKVSGDLANLLTGQDSKKGSFKASLGKDLQSVGKSMTQSSLKSMAQMGLSALGSKFGIHAPGAGKPDGTAANPLHVISARGGTTGGPDTDDPGSGANDADPLPAKASRGSGLGQLVNPLLSGIGNLAAKHLGNMFMGMGASRGISFMARGGDADPGKIYGVAEAGEAELISPKHSSRITPLSKLGGGDSHTHFNYSIDARGADLGAENRVARAIEFAHNSAVSNGVRANAERSKRTPQRK
jgi:hypothetical protein